MAGIVTYIRLPPMMGTDYDTLLSIQDEGTTGRGWNYKHIKLSNRIAVDKPVTAGQSIGFVAATNNAAIPPHVHIDRGDRIVDADRRKLFVPNLNPLLEFYGNQGILKNLDVTSPTVSSIKFRIQKDDVLAPGAGPDGNQGGHEQVRKTAHYFESMVPNTAFLHLGKLATSVAIPTNPPVPPVKPNDARNAVTDIIADAYDSFGGAHRLGLAALSFQIDGQNTDNATKGISSGLINSMNFHSMKDITDLKQFLDLNKTRTIYENSDQNNSKF